MSRIERVNILIVEREDQRIRREAEPKTPRDWAPGSSDPRKFPYWVDARGDLTPLPSDGFP